MVSTMEQYTHLLATIEKDLSSAWMTIAHEVAQEMTMVQQQWDHLFGIDPNAQNHSLGSSVTTTDHNGSGARPSSLTAKVHPFVPPPIVQPD